MIRSVLCLVLTLSGLRAAGAEGPADAAVEYLRTLQSLTHTEEIDASKLTALFDGTTRAKRAVIETEMRALAAELKEAQFEVLAEKSEGDLAAVLVAGTFGLNAPAARIHAVALISRNDTWQPAPVAGSFENLGLDYIPEFADRIKALTAWMSATTREETETLKKRIVSNLQKQIRETAVAGRLETITPPELVHEFLAATASGNLPAMLACLGGADTQLPPDFQASAAFLSSALKSDRNFNLPDPEAPDHLLAVVEEETTDRQSVVVLGDFDCLKTRRSSEALRIFTFDLTRTPAGHWALNPAPDLVFSQAALPSPDHQEAFTRALLASHPARPSPSPEDVARRALQAVAVGNAGALLEIVRRNSDVVLDDLVDLLRPLTLTRKLKRRPALLDIHSLSGDTAVALWVPYDLSLPEIDVDRLNHLHLFRTGEGWLVDVSTTEEQQDPELKDWLESQRKIAPADWYGKIGLQRLSGPAEIKSAPPEAVSKLGEDWIRALESQDLAAALSLSAATEGRKGLRHLVDYLGTEFGSGCSLTLLKTHSSGPWSAITIRHQPADGSQEPTYLLHPVVTTPAGPRVLAGAILYTADSRPRRLLNDLAWRRLELLYNSADLDPLREISRQHETLAGEDRPQP